MTPTITALVCTRNRGSMVANTIRGIMANDYPDFELIVIDQSTDGESEQALAEWSSDTRFHYSRMTGQGLSRARNVGIGKASTDVVAMTDDDCQVPRDWLRQMTAAFARSDRIALVFGNVLPAPHDREKGFVSAYLRKTAYIASRVRDKPKVEGIGACMGVRKAAWAALGGFDEMLGAGSRFYSADDTDFVIRALRAGYQVSETPEVQVVHHGFRTWAEGRTLISGYLYGIGAALAKHLRCGNWSVLHVLRALAWRWTFERPVVEFGFTPARSVRLSGFIRGFIAGSVARIDRHNCLFVARGKAAQPQAST